MPAAGIVGWLFAKQAEFYRQFTGLIRSAKTDGSAVWDLLGVSFLYGIFHAAGPGHGKAVIASYMVANRETWTRGIVLSFASALLQALVAIAVVGVAAALLNVRATTMNGAINVIETAGYALIIVVGLRPLWVKGRSLLSLLRTIRPPVSETYYPMSEVGAAVTAKLDGRNHDIYATPRTDHVHDHSHHGMTTPYIVTMMPAAAATPMVPNRRNLAGRADGVVDWRRSSLPVPGRVREPFSCWCSQWRRACSASAPARPW